ncbi:Glutaminase GtaA/Glutaminase A GtaA [Blumeria hordei DH14]|uniref:Glutaminase GtaA/Glutaminase A GtaA n=1 Tax=Blumeria graminis f. sp. hordei (strain DH14) TaxID=546991 RepID=N1JCK4_BLUG1|nr:Glutaminase GtaA/Glutaminase A GtaA [Blumeria hordei DH14]
MGWGAYSLAVALATIPVITQASTLTPPVLPLIVRNPYLSTWLGNARGKPWEQWPIFWTGQEVGLSVMASVPSSNQIFPLLGRPQDSLPKTSESFSVVYPDFQGATFDASTTNLTYNIPAPNESPYDAQITLSFLSPITPTSTIRQAIPASYMTIYATGSFQIDIYIDVNGQWVSGKRESPIVWELSKSTTELGDTKSSSLVTWKVRRWAEQLFTEDADRSEWGTLYFSAPSGVRYEAGTSALLRQKFARTGTLQNLVDDRYRPIMQDEPVFAFSRSFALRRIGSRMSTDSFTLTFAHLQDPVIRYASPQGLTIMRPLWASYYPSSTSLIQFHYDDFVKVSGLASNYSTQLEKDALASGSEDYKDIIALSARQVIGACSFAGTAEDPLIFFKEISSDGNMNTVDVIYPAFPFFLYTNPKWLAWLMEPLIEHMLSGQYPNNYSMHDLGSSFPNATGHPDGRDEYMPVEECGNMLIMGLALINSLKYDTKPVSLWSASGNENYIEPHAGKFSLHVDHDGMDDTFGGSIHAKGEKQARRWVERSYKLWKQWAGFLVREALVPANQLSTDDFAGWLANQTNLALKGIIGIRAMAEISALVGENEDTKYYLNISRTYLNLWENDYAISRDGTHAKLAYTWYGSWTTLYNLFTDALLCFHIPSKSRPLNALDPLQAALTETRISRTAFVDEKIYRIQSDWYHEVRQRYGLPLDSRHLYAKSDWEFFAVAVSSRQVREDVVQSIALWVNETSTALVDTKIDRPLTDLYDTEGTGGYPGFTFRARPVVGGHFAFLALERACGGEAVAALSFLDEVTPVEDERIEL